MKKKKQKIKISDKQKETKGVNVRRFAFTYLILMGGFFFLIGFKPIQDIIDINGLYTGLVVLLTSKVLGIMNIPGTFQGSIINLPSISLDVRFGCNGLEAVMIYSIAVIAFPSIWKKKVIGIIAGFFIIQIINIIRIAGLAYSAVHHKKLFEVIHIYVAQGIMIAVALGIFLLYLNYAGKQSKKVS